MSEYRSFAVKVSIATTNWEFAAILFLNTGQIEITYYIGTREVGREDVHPDLPVLVAAMVSGLAERGWTSRDHQFVHADKQ